MIQTLLFDQHGKPTQLGMRYVQPKYYLIKHEHMSGLANFMHRTTDPCKAISIWLRFDKSVIEVVW